MGLFGILGVLTGLAADVQLLICHDWLKGDLGSCSDQVRKSISNAKNSIIRVPILFNVYKAALNAMLPAFLRNNDPPVIPYLVGLDRPALSPAQNDEASVALPVSQAPGTVDASLDAASLTVRGRLDASWTTRGSSGWAVSTLNTIGATIRNAAGALVGTGDVRLSGTKSHPISVDGPVAASVNGQGSMSFYPPGGDLGASGNWESYSANVSGAVTLRFTTDDLLLDGALLPPGTRHPCLNLGGKS